MWIKVGVEWDCRLGVNKLKNVSRNFIVKEVVYLGVSEQIKKLEGNPSMLSYGVFDFL